MRENLNKIIFGMLMLFVHQFSMAAYAYIPPAGSQRISAAQEPAIVSEEDKKKAMLHYRRGKNMMLKKDYEEAIDEFRMALTFHPKWEPAERALSWAIKDQQRKELESSAGVSSLQEMVLKAQEYYNKGRQLEEQGNLVEAAVKYKAALRIIPAYPEALEALDRLQTSAKKSLVISGGTTFQGRSRTEAPNHRFGKSSNVDHESVADKIKTNVRTPNVPQGSGARQENNIKDAIEKHYLEGIRAMNAQEYVVAINKFELILDFMPNHAKAIFNLNNSKKALAKQIEETRMKAHTAKVSGDTVSEVKALRDMVKMDPDNTEARKAWEEARNNKESVINSLYRRGVEAYATGQYKEALQAWDLVLDLDPKHKKALESMKKAREKMELIKE